MYCIKHVYMCVYIFVLSTVYSQRKYCYFSADKILFIMYNRLICLLILYRSCTYVIIMQSTTSILLKFYLLMFQCTVQVNLFISTDFQCRCNIKLLVRIKLAIFNCIDGLILSCVVISIVDLC